MHKEYNQSPRQVLEDLHAAETGLSGREAETRLGQYGPNRLREAPKATLLQRFIQQLKDPMLLILMAAAAVSAVTNYLSHEPFTEVLIILAVVLLNAVLGVVQESKAEAAIEALQSMTAATSKVLRDGSVTELESSRLVPGDIVLLEAGDAVPADGRLLACASLQIEEAALTGESVPSSKSPEALTGEVTLGDRRNMAYMGSTVAYGRGRMVVTATGMDTEMGKIAGVLARTEQEETPLQKKLTQLGKTLSWLVLGICVFIFVFDLIVAGDFSLSGILETFMVAVSLAVAAIPEGLATVVTVVLSIGVTRMSRRNAVIRRLTAVETLGCTQVICSDKTGTLTQNKMTTKQVYADFQLFDGEKLDFANQAHHWLLKTAILANDSTSVDGKEIGDPTEVALINLSHNFWVEETVYRSQHPRLAELAFDSDRKLMSTMHKLDGVYTLCTKGAMDVLLARSVAVMTGDGPRPITEEDKQKIADTNLHLSENGLRVLAFAIKQYPDATECPGITLKDENDYTFVGLISMIDPPREESKKAVADAKRGGIRTVMITGDHKVTATAIAKEIGIFQEGDIAVSGVELDKMNDEELDKKLEHISVYARVSPEHKIRIVDAWQKKGKIVSMTGDGVNDAPALKKADIGVAMGITGTEVSKDAASMILTDDNFATIVKAVTNGRNVYANIKNAIKFLLSGNMSAILSVLYTSLFGLAVPFQPVHLLFINLLTDSLPAIAIGMEPAREDLLNQKPRNPKESIMTKDFMLTLLVQGALIGVFVMTAYHIGLSEGGAALASTMAFATLTLARLFHGFNCRADASIFKLGLRSNIYSILAFVAGLVLLNAVLFIPAFHGLFLVADLTLIDIGWIYLLAFIPTVLIQIYKVIKERVK